MRHKKRGQFPLSPFPEKNKKEGPLSKSITIKTSETPRPKIKKP
jgi:hypothetical protein